MQIAKIKEHCTGCTACASICPVGAIQMQPDEQGFDYPRIDAGKCINCHRCEKSCFYVSGMPDRTSDFKQECYAAWHSNDADHWASQSGGLGAALASYILSKGGVVYGASFDEQYVVRHQRYTTSLAAESLRGAKYVQSNMDGVFYKVKSDVLGGGTSSLLVPHARLPA